MYNIIKMDINKMFKTKSMHICHIVLVAIVVLFGILISAVVNMDYETGKNAGFRLTISDESGPENMQEMSEETYYEMLDGLKEEMNVNEFISMQYSGIMASILMIIFLGIFICSELEIGFIKNIIPIRNSRISLIVSKNIVIFIFLIIQAIVGFGAAIIASILVSGTVKILAPILIIKYLGIQIILRMAFASLLILISYLFKSKALSITIGVLLTMDIHGMVLQLLDKVIASDKIKLLSLSLVNHMKRANINEKNPARMIILALVFIILYNFTSMMVVRKMDIH